MNKEDRNNYFIEKMKKTIEFHDMIPRGSTVIVAVSGGMDSMALLHSLGKIQEEREAPDFKITVCHFNHSLRGEESDKDADFVREYSEKAGYDFLTKKEDIMEFSVREKIGIEESARERRYKFIKDQLKSPLDRVAVGHHMTDQFETVMLNLLRGSGINGISGMKYVNGPVIRPLLDFSCEEIETYIEDNNIPFRTDMSNLEPEYDRNKIRLNILPVFEENFSRDIVASVCKTSLLCRQDQEYLARESSVLYEENRQVNGLPVDLMLKLHPAMASRLIFLEYERARGDNKDLEYKHIKIIMDFLKRKTGRGKLDLPGKIQLNLEKGYFYMISDKS